MIPRNVWLVSLGFFWLFGGFAAAQQYLVPLLALQGREGLALTSLLVLYTAFLAANLAVPFVLGRIGTRWALIFGSLAFASFTASVAASGENILLYATSALAGIGSAFIWTAGAQVVRQASTETNLGKNLGFQSAIYWLGSWLGIALGAALLERRSIGDLYFIFLIGILLSTVVFWGITPSGEVARQDKVDLGYAFRGKLLFLAPVVVGTFFIASLGFSALNLIAVSFGLGFVGLLSTAGQASRILGGWSSGWMADRFSKEHLLYALIAISLAGILLVLVPLESVVLLGVVLLGLALAAVYPVTTAFLRDRLPGEEYTKATASFFLYTGVGSVAALVLTLLVDPRTAFFPGIALLVLAVPGIRLFVRGTKRETVS